MAFAFTPSNFAAQLFHDTMSGTPDNWANVAGATHSFSGGRMTFTDGSGGASEAITTQIVGGGQYLYGQFTWKYTSGSSTPIVWSWGDSAFNLGVGMYIDFGASGLLNARNGAAWTSTGVTLATNTDQQVEFLIDRLLGTWKLYFNGTLNGTYTIDTTSGANGSFTQFFFGGGSTAATEVYSIGEMYLMGGNANLSWNLANAYNMDGNSNDPVGSANGTDTSITYNASNGHLGQGAGLAGSPSKIENTSAITLTGNTTLAMWFKSSGSSTGGVLFGYSRASDNVPCFRVGFNTPTNSIDVFIRDTNSNNGNVDSPLAYADGNWHLAVAVMTGNPGANTSKIQLWIDGAVVATSDIAFTGTFPGRMIIGPFNGSSQYLTGDVDMCYHWNTNLGTADNLRLWAGGGGRQYPFASYAT